MANFLSPHMADEAGEGLGPRVLVVRPPQLCQACAASPSHPVCVPLPTGIRDKKWGQARRLPLVEGQHGPEEVLVCTSGCRAMLRGCSHSLGLRAQRVTGQETGFPEGR